MFKALKFVVKEHIQNIGRMCKIAVDHMKKQTSLTSLGIWWIFIGDIIHYAIYFTFRYLMTGGGDVQGMHILVFLSSGLVPWFFINDIINSGSKAILKNKAIITSFAFPITTIPTIEVLSIFIKRLFSLVIAFVIISIVGYAQYFNVLLFLYYFIAMFIFMVGFNLLISPMIALSNDFNMLYSSLTRLFFFATPVIWSFDRIQHMPLVITILKLNPFAYIIMGFRDAFYYGEIPDLQYSIYFWSLTIVVYFFGSYAQFRLRKYYADFI